MSAIQALQSFTTARVNMYVPNMKYAADVVLDGITRISFGSPAAASATAVVNAASINTAVTRSPLTYVSDANYGRALQIILSGAGTPTVTIYGRDFWGQPMAEQFTGNGAVAVNGVKAFKFVDAWSSTLVAATTLSIGTRNVFGLPYKCIKVISEELAGVISGTLGTLTAPVLTDPQTATTGDPRGLFTPNATPNATELTGHFLFDNSANASGNGGLCGIRHFTS